MAEAGSPRNVRVAVNGTFRSKPPVPSHTSSDSFRGSVGKPLSSLISVAPGCSTYHLEPCRVHDPSGRQPHEGVMSIRAAIRTEPARAIPTSAMHVPVPAA